MRKLLKFLGGMKLPVFLWIALFTLLVNGLFLYGHFWNCGTVSLPYVVISFFLSLNFMICLWEICLFIKIDKIKTKHLGYMKNHRDSKTRPAGIFLTSDLSLKRVFSPSVWCEIWATYSVFDPSYADRRSYGFIVDIGNGFSTLIPGLLFHIGLTTQLVDAQILGIIGLILFYQIAYGTVLYWVSFLVNKRHLHLTLTENIVFIAMTNAPWFVLGIYGMVVSFQMAVTNSYAVIGG